MKALLHHQPALNATRITLALVVAVLADVVQIPINFAATFLPQLRLINLAVDSLAAILTVGLLGFSWVLLPCMVLEALPVSLSMPSWTAAVAWVVWRRRREMKKAAPASADLVETSPQSSNEPASLMKRLLQVTRPLFTSQTSGLWILALTAALIAGLIRFHRGDASQPERRYFPDMPEVDFSSPPVFKFSANAHPGAKPILVVAPIENQSRRSQDVHPERIRAVVEDAFASMEAVQLLRPPPAQLRQPVVTDMVVFVTVLDMHDEAAAFNGYGIAAKTLATKCSLRLQLIKAADKTTVFSAVLDGSQTDVRTAAANAPFTNDRKLGAVMDALKGLAEDPKFQSAALGKNSPPR